jgi:hypothetical protein
MFTMPGRAARALRVSHVCAAAPLPDARSDARVERRVIARAKERLTLIL